MKKKTGILVPVSVCLSLSGTMKRIIFDNVVRIGGLEPPLREEPDPKSGAATNYAISAWFSTLLLHCNDVERDCKDTFFFRHVCFLNFISEKNL